MNGEYFQIKATTVELVPKYTFSKRGTDYYKVKWAGWPKEAWSWVKSIDIDAEPINDFQRAVLAKLPMKAWPTNQQNYQIPEQYRDEIKSNYEINKMRQREELDRKQQLLRRLDPAVLLGRVASMLIEKTFIKDFSDIDIRLNKDRLTLERK